LSIENAKERLKRYAQKGWLEVVKNSYTRNYRIAGNGRERLEWLRGEAEEAGERFSLD
jgi:hypothetical protein